MTTEKSLSLGRRHGLRGLRYATPGGTILYMNVTKARTTFARHGDMVGKNLFDCHGERSREIIRRLLADGARMSIRSRKRRPQNDHQTPLARGRRRGRTGRNLDGDSRRNAALHPQLIPERRSTRGAGVPRAVLRLRDSKSWFRFPDYASVSGIPHAASIPYPIPRVQGCACPGIHVRSRPAQFRPGKSYRRTKFLEGLKRPSNFAMPQKFVVFIC